jgi:hypothetical protein
MHDDKTIKYFYYFLAIAIIALIVYFVSKQVENYEKQDDPVLNELRNVFYEFFNQDKKWNGKISMLNNRKIMNEINLYKGEKSYTINKEKIHLCLKDEKGEYYNLNMLIYVLAHEFSHVLCTSIGHTQEFYEIFDELLTEMANDGFYNSNEEIISDYCEHGDKS